MEAVAAHTNDSQVFLCRFAELPSDHRMVKTRVLHGIELRYAVASFGKPAGYVPGQVGDFAGIQKHGVPGGFHSFRATGIGAGLEDLRRLLSKSAYFFSGSWTEGTDVSIVPKRSSYILSDCPSAPAIRFKFFGETIIGPMMPNLTYMLVFEDLNERDERWGVFGSSPEWKKLRSDPRYKDTVSNITDIILRPTPYSQI